jgi:hypothetical protein
MISPNTFEDENKIIEKMTIRRINKNFSKIYKPVWKTIF